jgi:hypothetical protein
MVRLVACCILFSLAAFNTAAQILTTSQDTSSSGGAAGQATASPTSAGNGIVYVYRKGSIVGTAGRPLIFVNDEYRAELHNSNYASLEVPQGALSITATVSLLKYGRFPPPTGEWASGPGCASVDWRRLVVAPSGTIARCKDELTSLFMRCGVRWEGVFPIIWAVVPKCNYKLNGADAAFNYAGLAMRPKELAHERLHIEVEAGKTYYVKWSGSSSGGKMQLQDAAAGAKEIRKLHPVRDQ